MANASLYRTHDAQELERLLDRLEKAIADLEAQNEAGEDAPAVHLPDELAGKQALRERVRQALDDLGHQDSGKRINLTGQDAKLMRTRQGIAPGYNAQAMVSPFRPDGQSIGVLITAVDVVDEAHDYARLLPMLEQAEEITGVKAPMTLADAGYHSSTNLEKCAERDQPMAMPEAARQWSRDHPYHKERFTYDAAGDSFTCPQDQRMHYIGIKQAHGVPYRRYQAPRAVCQACPAFGVCTKAKRMGRTVTMGPGMLS